MSLSGSQTNDESSSSTKVSERGERSEKGGAVNELEAWKEVHDSLTAAVQISLEAVAALKAQHRYWLEEICANLTDEGKLQASSVWLRPVPPKKTKGKSGKANAAGGSKRKKKATGDSGNKEENKPAKKPRKKKAEKKAVVAVAVDEETNKSDDTKSVKKVKISLKKRPPSTATEASPAASTAVDVQSPEDDPDTGEVDHPATPVSDYGQQQQQQQQKQKHDPNAGAAYNRSQPPDFPATGAIPPQSSHQWATTAHRAGNQNIQAMNPAFQAAVAFGSNPNAGYSSSLMQRQHNPYANPYSFAGPPQRSQQQQPNPPIPPSQPAYDRRTSVNYTSNQDIPDEDSDQDRF